MVPRLSSSPRLLVIELRALGPCKLLNVCSPCLTLQQRKYAQATVPHRKCKLRRQIMIERTELTSECMLPFWLSCC
jgi:hypothetical protein